MGVFREECIRAPTRCGALASTAVKRWSGWRLRCAVSEHLASEQVVANNRFLVVERDEQCVGKFGHAPEVLWNGSIYANVGAQLKRLRLPLNGDWGKFYGDAASSDAHTKFSLLRTTMWRLA